jgi:hypothetical protein
MKIRIHKRGRVKLDINDEHRNSYFAERHIARAVNRVELPAELPEIKDDVNDTHTIRWPDGHLGEFARSEPKAEPRSYRPSFATEEEIESLKRTLGVESATAVVEICVHAVAERLGIVKVS